MSSGMTRYQKVAYGSLSAPLEATARRLFRRPRDNIFVDELIRGVRIKAKSGSCSTDRVGIPHVADAR